MDLPEEVIAQILSWLPVKSLMRFRCVSKTWLHLLSFDSGFMKLHFDRSFESNKNKNPSIMVSRGQVLERTRFYYVEDYTSCHKAIGFDTPFTNPSLAPNLSSDRYYDFRVVDICNGLICLTDYYNADCSKVYVWNPLTGDHVPIPCPHIPTFPLSNDGFSDLITDVVFGFGFDRGSNEYKIVRVISVSVWERLLPFQSHVCVYTLGTNSWRIIDEITYNISLDNYSSAFVNGAIHWLAPKVEPFTWDVLVSFDIRDEVFCEVPQPSGVIHSGNHDDDTYDTIVGELGGLLCIFCRVHSKEIQIWVMKEYGAVDSWTLQFRFGQPGTPPLDPLAIANNGEMVIWKDNSQLILYNPCTNSIRNLDKFSFRINYASAYVESLVSPTIINGATQIDHRERESTFATMAKFACYVVIRGRRPGVYSTWDECKAQINSYCGALYWGCHSEEEAVEALTTRGHVNTPPIRDTDTILDMLKSPNIVHDPPCSSISFPSPTLLVASIDEWKFEKRLVGILLIALITLVIVVISIIVKLYLL